MRLFLLFLLLPLLLNAVWHDVSKEYRVRVKAEGPFVFIDFSKVRGFEECGQGSWPSDLSVWDGNRPLSPEVLWVSECQLLLIGEFEGKEIYVYFNKSGERVEIESRRMIAETRPEPEIRVVLPKRDFYKGEVLSGCVILDFPPKFLKASLRRYSEGLKLLEERPLDLNSDLCFSIQIDTEAEETWLLTFIYSSPYGQAVKRKVVHINRPFEVVLKVRAEGFPELMESELEGEVEGKELRPVLPEISFEGVEAGKELVFAGGFFLALLTYLIATRRFGRFV